MLLKDLPQPIRELAEKRIREQGNKPESGTILAHSKFGGGFNWCYTEEGDNFWEEINNGNLAPFYERYPEAKQYTLEQLREEKIAVLVENQEQKRILGIKLNKHGIGCYWRYIKNDWYYNDDKNERYFGHEYINFSQVILPEAKQEVQNDELSANCRMLKYKPNQEPTNDENQEAGEGADCHHPSNKHYKQTTIEPIAVIQDWKLSFCLGNVIKYIGRAEHKGNKLADLEKAADYLRIEIEQLKKG